MTNCKISGVNIAGIASAVPETFLTVADDSEIFGQEEMRKLSESTGVQKRHIAPKEMCTSDLCFAAAEKLLSELNWSRDSIDTLIFVSQTPDYFLPATSCSLHHRLGLSKHCAAFDLNLGCSGYVYGLWVASNLLSQGNVKRLLLLVGDTITKLTSPQDRSVAPLFGDAGTATALEHHQNADAMVFQMGTDGSGEPHLIVPVGAFRQPHTEKTTQRKERESGNIRSDEDLYMNGTEIFTFTLREVPKLINSTLNAAEWTLESVDTFVMHQANRFMLQHLTKKMKLPPEKVIVTLADYGNTSSASIPLAITHSLTQRSKNNILRLVLAGFGVGFSWGAVALTFKNIILPDLVIVK